MEYLRYLIIRITGRFRLTRPLWEWYTTHRAKKAFAAMTPREQALHQAQAYEMTGRADKMTPCPNGCGNMARSRHIVAYGECAACFVGPDYWDVQTEPVEVCSNCGSNACIWLYDPESENRFKACENCSQVWVSWIPEPCMFCGADHHPAKCSSNPWRNNASIDKDEPPF